MTTIPNTNAPVGALIANSPTEYLKAEPIDYFAHGLKSLTDYLAKRAEMRAIVEETKAQVQERVTAERRAEEARQIILRAKTRYLQNKETKREENRMRAHK